MKVLLVDDHPLILSALHKVIQGLGDDVSVLGAGSAAEARAAISKAMQEESAPETEDSGKQEK